MSARCRHLNRFVGMQIGTLTRLNPSIQIKIPRADSAGALSLQEQGGFVFVGTALPRCPIAGCRRTKGLKNIVIIFLHTEGQNLIAVNINFNSNSLGVMALRIIVGIILPLINSAGCYRFRIYIIIVLKRKNRHSLLLPFFNLHADRLFLHRPVEHIQPYVYVVLARF